MEIKIRPGIAADVHKVTRLWVKMCNETTKSKTPNVSLFKSLYASRIQESDFVILVAEEGGRLVGFVSAYAYENTETGKRHGQAPHMYVEPENRMSGVAGQLYTKIGAEMKKRNCVVFEHYCEENLKDFWSKRGYRVSKCLMTKGV